MVVCYLGVGSNLGNRRQNINRAVVKLNNTVGIKVDKVSRFYETEPIGGPPQPEFLNAALRIKTSLSPERLLSVLKSIEKELGRVPHAKNGPRPIDLDILLYANKIINKKKLKIPHPRMFEREFVLFPLSEVV